MAVLVSFMAGVFFSISHGYLENLFREYATAAQQANADQWERLLSYYYRLNGYTWTGVDQYVIGIFQQTTGEAKELRPEYLVVFDANNHTVFSAGVANVQVSPGQLARGRVPITVDGNVVGSFWIQDSSSEGLRQVEQTVLNSMTTATFLGTAITVFVALLSGAWLARRMTLPLQEMMLAINKITHGDLSARVPMQSSDEFGEVATAFNDMTVRLLKTEEARRRLVADVAHELRTPLTIMQGQLELIQQGVKQPDPATLLPIQDEVMRLTSLVQDLHQLSLAEVGKLSLERQNVNLVQLVERVVMNFEIEAEENQMTIHFRNQSPGEVMVHVDPHRMTQVFINLIGNALQYTPNGGEVVVQIGAQQGAHAGGHPGVQAGVHVAVRDGAHPGVQTGGHGSMVEIAVQDNGPGIDPEHLPYVFDRFYRADEDRSRGTGGMGLGLAIVKEFVQAHEGTIEVESTLGQGTTFRVRLPLASS